MEEIASYDALAENNNAVELLSDDKLRVIATELVSHSDRSATGRDIGPLWA